MKKSVMFIITVLLCSVVNAELIYVGNKELCFIDETNLKTCIHNNETFNPDGNYILELNFNTIDENPGLINTELIQKTQGIFGIMFISLIAYYFIRFFEVR